jgi:hypothetical protein
MFLEPVSRMAKMKATTSTPSGLPPMKPTAIPWNPQDLDQPSATRKLNARICTPPARPAIAAPMSTAVTITRSTLMPPARAADRLQPTAVDWRPKTV